MEGESAFGYLNRTLELDLSECSSRLEKRCENASHSKALRVKSMTGYSFFAKALECGLPARPCAGVLASLWLAGRRRWCFWTFEDAVECAVLSAVEDATLVPAQRSRCGPGSRRGSESFR